MLALPSTTLFTLALSLLASFAEAKSACPRGSYSHSDRRGCYPCAPHALTCHSKTLALSCENGYAVKSGFCVKKTTSKPATKSCPSGFYSHSDKLGCYPCGPHAVTCRSKGLALTCESGYTAQNGYCLRPAAAGAASTVTVTAGFAPTVTATLTSTSTKAGATVTLTSTSTSTVAASTSVVLSTTTLTIVTPTVLTKSATTTVTSTSTPLALTTVHSAANAVATSFVRNSQFEYAGCYGTLTLNGGSIPHTIPVPSPFTVSAAVATCYAHAMSYPGVQYCAIHAGPSPIIFLINGTPPSGTPNDANCDQLCPATQSTLDRWGQEICGGTQYFATYKLTSTL